MIMVLIIYAPLFVKQVPKLLLQIQAFVFKSWCSWWSNRAPSAPPPGPSWPWRCLSTAVAPVALAALAMAAAAIVAPMVAARR